MGNMCSGWVQGVLDTLRDKLDIMRDKAKGEEVAMDTKKESGEVEKKEEEMKEKEKKEMEQKEKEKKEKEQKEMDKKEKEKKEKEQKEKEKKEKEQKEEEKREKQKKEKELKEKEKKEKEQREKDKKEKEKKEKHIKEKEKKEKEKKKKNKKSADADTSMTGLRGVATTFSLSGDAAQEAFVAGSFSGWEKIRLERREDGVLSAVVELEPGQHQYKFLVDGEWRLDTGSGVTVDNGLGSTNNVITVQREQLVQ